MATSGGASAPFRSLATEVSLLFNGTGGANPDNSITIDATGEKGAYCGPVWFAERTGTKNITRVGFRFGTIAKAGGSALTVSLQDASVSGGTSLIPQLVPDEVQDQTVAIANGNASFASNTWIRTGAFSADRTVSFGEMVCVVVEFDGAGRLGADAVNLSCLQVANRQLHNSHVAGKVAGAWLSRDVAVNLVLEFSDGTFGTLYGGFPTSAIGTLNYQASSSPDEYALEFTPSADVTIDAASFYLTVTATDGDVTVSLYDSGGSVLTSTLLHGHWGLISQAIHVWTTACFPDAVALTAGNLYRIGVRAESTTNVAIQFFDVSDAAHMAAHVGGTTWAYASRTNLGAWTTTTTRRLFLYPHFSFTGSLDALCSNCPPPDLGGDPCVDGELGPLAWLEWQRRIPE